jgi:hypothetical protein
MAKEADAAVVDWSWSSRRWLPVVLALLALTVGVLVYVLDRPGSTYFLSGLPFRVGGHGSYFGSIGGQIPEFVHVYAFILLTVAVSSARSSLLRICIFWWALDSLFKLGLHRAVAPHVVQAIPSWFQDVPVLENTASYFTRGTFDPLDLVAIALGTVAAYLTVRLISKGRTES